MIRIVYCILQFTALVAETVNDTRTATELNDNTELDTCNASSITTGVSQRLLQVCSSNQYYDGSVCQPCDLTCLSCFSGSSSDCTACDNSQHFIQPTGGSTIFSCICQDGYYYLSQTCQPCHQSCETCSGPNTNNCQTCHVGSLRTVNGSSECACGSGYYDLGDYGVCQVCDSACQECQGSSSYCLQCSNPLKALNNCVSCVNPLYSSSSNCINCANTLFAEASNCSNCKNTLFSSSSSCINCANTLFAEASNCLSCKNSLYSYSSNCINCANTLFAEVTNCLSCKNTLYSSSSNCINCANTLFDETFTCLSCKNSLYSYSSNCINCANTLFAEASNCLSCKNSLYSYSSNCINCTNTLFAEASNCLSCKNTLYSSSSNCINCANTLFDETFTCLSCKNSLYSYSSNCINCANTLFAEASNCLSCKNSLYSSSSSCTACSNTLYDVASTCLLCLDPLKLYPNCNSCIDSIRHIVSNQCVCIDGYALDISTSTCKICHSSCLTCSGFQSNQCLSCDSAAKRHNSPVSSPFSCLCDSSYFEDSSLICQQCNYSCLECNSASSTDCSSCASDRTLNSSNQCICNSGTFENSSKTCQNCDQSCQECSGSSKFACTQCNPSSPHFRTPSPSSAAVAPYPCKCLDPYYEDSFSSTCKPCHYSCLTCSGPSNSDCLTCQPKRNFLTVSGSSGTCTCVSSYFEDSTNSFSCSQCYKTCKECNGPLSTQCILCDSTSPVFRTPSPISMAPFSCDCLSHYFEDISNQTCKICHFTCLECSGSADNDCKSCLSSSFRGLTGSTCPCNSHYVSDGVNSLCQECHYSCTECSLGNDKTACTTCNLFNHRDFLSGECLCHSGYFDDQSTQPCGKCQKTCLTCSNATSQDCLTCDTTKFIAVPTTSPNNKCICVSTSYYDSPSNSCLSCHPTCKSCTGPLESNCLTCYSSQSRIFNFSNTTCECIPRYFSQNNSVQCYSCDSTCDSCIGYFYNQCSACSVAQKRTYIGDYYLCNCQDGYYSDSSNVCQLCSSNCLTCETTSTTCTSCVNNLQISSSNHTCGCQSHEFYNNLSQACEPCDQSCEKCLSALNSDCLSCTVGYSMTSSPPSTCVLSTSIQSSLCNPKCLTCDSLNHQICLSCPANSILNSSTILLNGLTTNLCSCIDGYYFRQSTFDCQPCHYSCSTCIGPFSHQCLVCGTNRIIPSSFSGSHVFPCICPSGTYGTLNQSICLACQIPCIECAGSAYFCTLCKPQFQLGGGSCSCLQGYSYSSSSNDCLKCHISCQNCDGTTENDCITCSSINRSIKVLQTIGGIQSGSCSCKDGYVHDGVADCILCDSTCETCLGNKYFCTKCYAQSYRQLNILTNACDCMDKYYETDDRQCSVCPYDCLKCDQNNKCIKCDTSIRQFVSSTSRCMCKEGYYQDHIQCIPCDDSCETCETSSNQCTNCIKKMTLNTSNQCECNQGFYQNPAATGKTDLCIACIDVCYQCTDGKTCTECDNSNYFTFNSTSQLCQCYYGRELTKNSTGSVNCVEMLYYQVDRQSFWRFNQLKYLSFAGNVFVFLSVFLGSPTVSQTALFFFFDLAMLLFSNVQKPDVVKDILQDIYDYSLVGIFTNVFSISTSQPIIYLNKYLKEQNISGIIESTSFQIVILSAIQLSCRAIITILPKKKILSFNSFSKISHRSILVYRTYHLKIFNIYHSIVDMIHYQLLMMSMITVFSNATVEDFFFSSIFLIYLLIYSYMNITHAEMYFEDQNCNNIIINRSSEEKQRLIYQHQSITGYICLSGLNCLFLGIASSTTYLAVISITRFAGLLPLSLLQFNKVKYEQILSIIFHSLFAFVVLFFYLSVSNSEIKYMTTQAMAKINAYSLVFEIFVMILLLSLAIVLAADIAFNIYKSRKQAVDKNQLIENLIEYLNQSLILGKQYETFLDGSVQLAKYMTNIPPKMNAINVKQKKQVIRKVNLFTTKKREDKYSELLIRNKQPSC